MSVIVITCCSIHSCSLAVWYLCGMWTKFNQYVLEMVGCQLKSAYIQIFFASVQTRNESPIIGLQQNPQQDEESSARPAVSAASPVWRIRPPYSGFLGQLAFPFVDLEQLKFCVNLICVSLRWHVHTCQGVDGSRAKHFWLGCAKVTPV